MLLDEVLALLGRGGVLPVAALHGGDGGVLLEVDLLPGW